MNAKTKIFIKAHSSFVAFILASALNAQTIISNVTYDTPGTHNVQTDIANVTVDPTVNKPAITVTNADMVFNLSYSSFDNVSRSWMPAGHNMNGSVLGVYATRDSAYNMLTDVALTIDNTSFTNNKGAATYQAFGTVWLRDLKAPVTISNSTFSGNTLTSVSQAWGGAIAGYGTEKTVIDKSTFEGNKVDANQLAYGGAIILTTSSSSGPGSLLSIDLDVSDSLFKGNQAKADGAAGGAIAKAGKSGGTVNITNTTFTNNVAIGTDYGYSSQFARGGAIYIKDSNINFVAKNNTHIVNTGNLTKIGDDGAAFSAGGGFLYSERGTPTGYININFDIEAGSSMTIGVRGKANEDSIATNNDKNAVLTKDGDGLLTVNGSMKEFFGALRIENGIMAVNGGLTATVVQILQDAVLALGDDVRVNDLFEAQTNSNVELFVNSKSDFVQVAMDSNSAIYIDPNAALTVTIADGFTYEAGDSYMLFLFDDYGFIDGSFDSVIVSSSDGRVIDSADYIINYIQTGLIQGIELLFLIPEPAEVAMLLGAFALAIAAYRRRK